MALASLGLLVIGSIPTVIGVAEAIDGQKKQNQQAKDRIKFNITTLLSADGESPPQQATVVFKEGKLWLDHPAHPVSGYKFNGFYFGYPGENPIQGMVSMACDNPPALHWIFVDKDTGALRHGSRSDSAGHIVGPWNWTEDEQFVALEGTPAFLAVENEDGAWQVHFDKTGERDFGNRVVEDIMLHRELQLGVASSYVGGK
ncbi:uncharacterized protein BCR38DRAFT_447200 [Pseudomassariella vexata]|uniref:Uncharacterized protein n=1 Tax=Pseudomassariella vexata TaxID=1141098 RepID=A0A1Y2DHX8_9PEZI|nr:uncharacterized protein BCR38DRAFT_447200 [Pseudomassariella vexata]ORY58405.1 hypothetical protein BCR38DRAFT_447200 [Pseudomassariella vexata]